MRVILVNKFHYRKGGAETYYLTLGERLKAMGHEVAYFSMRHPENLPCTQAKYFVTQREYNDVHNPIKAARDGLALIYSHEAKHHFETLCEDFRPDVVHLNNVHRQITLSILDAPYLDEHGVPVVYTAHDYVTVCPGYLMLNGEGDVCDECLRDGYYRHCIEKRCVKGSRTKSALAVLEASFNRAHHTAEKIDAVIAPSEFIAGKLIEGGWSASKILYMQNFVGEEVLRRASDSQDRTDRTNPYILYFGRLSHEKGVDVLIDGFDRACEMLPEDWRLVIAGDGSERDVLEARAHGCRNSDRMEFVGFQSGQVLVDLVEQASFVCQPSRCRENMPLSSLEAFSLGTPVVGARIGGIPEIVIEDETGLLHDPGDSVALAGALVKACEKAADRPVYRMMQRKCRSYVITRCNQEGYMGGLIGLYKELIDGKRS